MSSRSSFFRTAVAFEGGLGVGALLLGWLLGLATLYASVPVSGWMYAAGFGWGLLAALPMVALVPILDRAPLPGLEQLRSVVHEQLVPLVRELSLLQMAIIALAAGWGEELLFRGLIQTGLARWLATNGGWWIGLAVATVLFGLCHAITPSYAILAGLMGLYLGGLLLATDNLLAPITTHALYDFAALVYLARSEVDNAPEPAYDAPAASDVAELP